MAAIRDTIILYPLPAMGHLVPAVELAKLFLTQHFEVVIVLMDIPLKLKKVTEFIETVSTEQPSITFHQLPPPAAATETDDAREPIRHFFDHMRRNNDNLKTFISDHCNTSIVRGIVIDFLCTDALDVALELSLPAYFFVTSGAFVLAVYLYLPTLHDMVATSYKEIGEGLLEFPGLPLIPANHLPDFMMDRNSCTYEYKIRHFSHLRMADGIFINSFEKLEARAVRALRNGLCTPGRRTPPVYCIGPLIAEEQTSEREQKHECLAWLDSQPEDSVVFLCFGSMGMTFKAEQIKEIAEGLERSQQRFLWVVRAPPSPRNDVEPLEHLIVEPELEALLPPGFLERTKDMGLVVKKWAPQRAILTHRAVGGFVTHCGWNSVLESVTNGVAMIAWPLYVEQRLNKVCLVEMQIAVAMEGYDKELVVATEVEAKVRWLMDLKGGEALRGRAKVLKERAMEVSCVGGSSEQAFLEVAGVLRG